MAYLLDTNTLIYLFKNTGAVRWHLAQQKDRDIKLCTPVLWELLTGALKSQSPQVQLDRLDLVKTRFDILTFDLPAAEAAARIRADLEAKGAPIGPVDTLIAGIALAHNLILVTHNTREFGRVNGLAVQDWYEALPL
jgi:tRNA(fMet)-specific endonuclease VapC